MLASDIRAILTGATSVGVGINVGEAIRACGQHDIATRKVDAIFDIVVVARQ